MMSEEKYPKVVMPQCDAEKFLKGQKALIGFNADFKTTPQSPTHFLPGK